MCLFSTHTAVCVKCVVPAQWVQGTAICAYALLSQQCMAPAQWVQGTAICACVLLSQQCVLNETVCVSKLEIAAASSHYEGGFKSSQLSCGP